MTKELEAFRDILGILSAVSGCEVDMNSERVRIVKSALQRLEAIDNAKSSEALEKLENIWCDISTNYVNEYVTIKQALLKAQEQEKAIEIIKEHKLLNYVLKNSKCAKMYNLKQEEIDLLKEVIK